MHEYANFVISVFRDLLPSKLSVHIDVHEETNLLNQYSPYSH